MKSGIHKIAKKIALNFSANSLTSVVSIVTQILSVPLMIKYWGTTQYSAWIYFVAIRSYIQLIDLGIVSTTANSLTQEISLNRGLRAQSLYTQALTCCVLSGSMVPLICMLYYIFCSIAKIEVLLLAEQNVMLLLIILLVLPIDFATGMLKNAYRALDKYGVAELINASLIAVDLVLTVTIVVTGGGPVTLATTILVNHFAFLALFIAIGRNSKFPLKPKLVAINISILLPLIRKGLSSLPLPLTWAIINSGPIILLDYIGSKSDVISYNCIRTISNTIMAFSGVLLSSAWPEYTRLIAVGMQRTVTKLLIYFECIVFIGGLFLSILLIYNKDQVFDRWTHGLVQISTLQISLFLLRTIVQSLWHQLTGPFMAANKYYPLALILLTTSIFGILVGGGLFGVYGLVGLAIGFIVSDMISAVLLTYLYSRSDL